MISDSHNTLDFLWYVLNYILTRPMQFLSMKLATVNPRLDFNIEELLAKEVGQLLESNAV